MNIEIKGKIKVNPSNNYLLVIEDEEGTNHFWMPNGKYDGYSKLCKKTKKEKK